MTLNRLGSDGATRSSPVPRVTGWRKGMIAVVVVVIQALGTAASLEAQVRIQDLVFTGGVSVEGYNGNFSAVTVPLVDSTNSARATIGEVAASGLVHFLDEPSSRVSLRFDLGLRQYAATGFRIRDYAPREWAGSVDLSWSQSLGPVGFMSLTAAGRGRSVADRPPMPLFLQPGYGSIRGTVAYQTPSFDGVAFDLQAELEEMDYEAVDLFSQLDLLDRESLTVETGVRLGRGSSTVRVFGAYRESDYPRQDSFDPEDPFRRDQAVTAGISWSLESAVTAELGVDATLNRSNSRRPEYDAFSARGRLNALLPWWRLGVNVFGVLTAKDYVHDTPFARLVPGEEADNVSQVYLDLTRPVALNVESAIRFGWTRAETDLADTYYSRFGVSLRMNYRPGWL